MRKRQKHVDQRCEFHHHSSSSQRREKTEEKRREREREKKGDLISFSRESQNTTTLDFSHLKASRLPRARPTVLSRPRELTACLYSSPVPLLSPSPPPSSFPTVSEAEASTCSFLFLSQFSRKMYVGETDTHENKRERERKKERKKEGAG